MRLIGVRLVSDIHERACEIGLPPPLDAKRRRWLDAVRQARLIFIHVPKNGGMSINHALYGEHVTHCSIRYYRRAAPDLAATLPSFALIRDPLARFLSAYRYARAGGGSDNRVSPAFRDRYRGFACVDDALDHIERANSPYAMDHIFRPQAWFLTDRTGHVAVDRLVPFRDIARLPEVVPGFPPGALAHLNRVAAPDVTLRPRHVERLRHLYASDFALHRMVTGGEDAVLPACRYGAERVAG